MIPSYTADLLAPAASIFTGFNNNNNNNNLYLKRVTQSNGKDLPWGPLACLH